MRTVRYLFFSLLVSLVGSRAFAEAKVIFFGGSASQKSVLDGCFPNFENHGYPVTAAEQRAVINEINSHPHQQYVVAGHSSGSRFAINVAKAQLTNPSRITLIDLDGYAPQGVPTNIKRVCWNAVGGSRGTLHSRNFDSMDIAHRCEEEHTYPAPRCRTKWCVHFSIVNPATPPDLHDGTWETQGYQGCSEKNLEWLNPAAQAPQHFIPPSGIRSAS